VNWNLLVCAFRQHVSYAPAEREIRENLRATSAAGEAWQCLRCATFILGPPAATGPAAGAPWVRRDDELRSAFILRVFALERFVRALVFVLIAYGIWRFKYSRYSVEQAFNRELPEIRSLLRGFGYDVNHSGLVGLIRHSFTLNSGTLTLLAFLAAGYALLVILEATGLWLLKRWGEYFAMVATSALIPYEIYELVAKVTALRTAAFVINLALVAYLVLTKRLFGARGGKKAYEARLRSESLMQAAMDAARRRLAPGQPGEAGQPEPPEPPGDAGAPREVTLPSEAG
jgi:uncharacterized membrane protein (DUF2068 family)